MIFAPPPLSLAALGVLEAPLQAWLAGVLLTIALAASGHAILYKRDSRSSAIWVILIWILPLAGSDHNFGCGEVSNYNFINSAS